MFPQHYTLLTLVHPYMFYGSCIFAFPFFSLENMQNLTILVIFKCTVQWPSVHSHCCASSLAITHPQNIFHLPELTLGFRSTNTPCPLPSPHHLQNWYRDSTFCLYELDYSRKLEKRNRLVFAFLWLAHFIGVHFEMRKIPERSGSSFLWGAWSPIRFPGRYCLSFHVRKKKKSPNVTHNY